MARSQFAATCLAAVLVVTSVAAAIPPSNPTNEPRYWPKYAGRRSVVLLDGNWSSGQLGSIDEPPTAFDSMDPSFGPESAASATPNISLVPACVDNTPPGYVGYRGVTMYRTEFTYNLSEAPAAIQFQACSFYCRVWVNGVEIGDHRAGGYVAFALNVPMSAAAKDGSDSNELFVLADNRFNSTTAPMHTGGDFWHFGGIMRSVELHALPAPQSNSPGGFPWRAYALPASMTSVNVSVQLTDTSFNGDVNLSIGFDNGPPVLYGAQAVNGSVDIGTIDVPQPRAWSTTDPQLHIVQVELNGASVIERFGLRQFGVDNETARLTLNGEVIKLVGWNHHTQWPNTSASPTDDQLDADIKLLQRGGANYVRGAHYPQDPRWLDRLDEAGMVMWSETLGPGVSVDNTTDPVFMSFQKQQLNEMIDNAMNHASIMTWGWFNEGPSDKDDACPAYQACADIANARDPTRFTTWASDKNLHDVCFEAASLISFNNYPAWYTSGEPAETWNNFANSVHAGSVKGTIGKPFVISETGAGGIYEWSHNASAEKWTLAFQTQIIIEDVETALANDNVSGITLWHFFDFKTNDATENNTHCDYIPDVYPPTCAYINVSSGRPGGENHKGVIDFWRREKPAYQAVAAKYNATKSGKD